MRRSETVALLRQYAEAIGAPQPTERQVRDWVDEGLLQRAKRRGLGHGKGVEWIDPIQNLEIGKEIVRLKNLGVERVAELRVHLFLTGMTSTTPNLREAFIEEHDRAIKRLFRGKTLPKDYQRARPESSNTIDEEVRRLGELDGIFKSAGLELTKLELLKLTSQAHHEFEPGHGASNSISDMALKHFGIDHPSVVRLDIEGLLVLREDNDTDRATNLFKSASDAELAAARVWFVASKEMLRIIASEPELAGWLFTAEQQKAFHDGALALELTNYAVTIFPPFIEVAKCWHDQHPDLPIESLETISIEQLMNGLNAANIGRNKPAS